MITPEFSESRGQASAQIELFGVSELYPSEVQAVIAADKLKETYVDLPSLQEAGLTVAALAIVAVGLRRAMKPPHKRSK